MNIDLQQRSVEFSQLFKSHGNLRSALLEKMPPMQVTRESNQNADEESEGNELIENGVDDGTNVNSKMLSNDSVSFIKFSMQSEL